MRVNSTFYRSRRSLMTGECKVHMIPVYDNHYVVATRLTDTNTGLLIMGMIFLIGSIILWIPLFIKCKTAS